MARDRRLDTFRGVALLMIFIDHMPSTIYENVTIRNWGFSDAAEAFVLMSGVAAGLAYSPSFIGGDFWRGWAKTWARARTLYVTHIVTTVIALGIAAALVMWSGATPLLADNNVAPIFSHPLPSLIGIPTMGQQLGYFNILPLYCVLLLTVPLILPFGLRHPAVLLAGSILLWAIAGQFHFDLPNYPNSGGWFFNPFSWQLIFVAGLLSGVGMRVGVPFVPYNRTLFWLCAGFVIFVLLWVRIPPLADVCLHILGWFAGLGLPFYVTWFDKTYLALPRLLQALALAYVVANLVPVHRFAGSRYAEPFALLGRHGLPVFATGSVLDWAFLSVKVTYPGNWFTDLVMLGTIFGTTLLVAYVLEQLNDKDRPRVAKAASVELTPRMAGQ